jgi:hypothetical protein
MQVYLLDQIDAFNIVASGRIQVVRLKEGSSEMK